MTARDWEKRESIDYKGTRGSFSSGEKNLHHDHGDSHMIEYICQN
jgi:hypothetical protein